VRDFPAKYSRTAASRNTGIDTPRIAATIMPRSANPPTRTALIEPSTIEATSHSSAAGTTSESVTGNRCAN
jgi:hypothetical protein